MAARLCIFVCALAVSPPASPAPAPAPTAAPVADPLAEAERVVNERGQLAAAEYAATTSARAELPRATRLELALFASSTYATLYQFFPDDPPGDPIYLCRALAMLDASVDLAAKPEDFERHRAHREVRQTTLEQKHPDYRCPEVQVEAAAPLDGGLMPVPTSRRTPLARPTTSARPSVDVRPVRPSPSTLRLRRRALAWTAVGGTALTFGVASFAGMGGALALREDSRQRTQNYDSAAVSPEQRMHLEIERARFERASRLTIAAAVVGTVMFVTGLASVARGSVLRGRLRVTPDGGAGRVGLILSGHF